MPHPAYCHHSDAAVNHPTQAQQGSPLSPPATRHHSSDSPRWDTHHHAQTRNKTKQLSNSSAGMERTPQVCEPATRATWTRLAARARCEVGAPPCYHRVKVRAPLCCWDAKLRGGPYQPHPQRLPSMDRWPEPRARRESGVPLSIVLRRFRRKPCVSGKKSAFSIARRLHFFFCF